MKTETAKATKQEIFTKLQKSVALDKRLEKTTASLFLKMLGLAMISNFTTMTFSAKIEQLAEALAMSTRTVRRHLPKLIRFGYVLASRHKSGRKMNMPNVYTMLNPFEESQQRLCEANSVKILGQNWQANTIETLSRDIRTKELKETNTTWEAETSSVVFSTTSYVEPEALSEAPKVSETNLNETDCEKPEVQSPKQKTISKAKSSKKPEMDVSNVPDNLKPTARLLLGFSERTRLKEDEVKLLVLLLEKHYQTRINREIEHQAERFKKEGRNMHSLQVFLLYEILKNQRSRPLDEPETEAQQAEPITDPQTEAIYERLVAKPSRATRELRDAHLKLSTRDKNIPAPVSQPVELAMPVEEAEKAITANQYSQTNAMRTSAKSRLRTTCG